MNTPLFEKITFHKVDTYDIKQKCYQENIGHFPVVVEIGSLPVDQFLENFETVIKELGIHPLFPYPIYVLTDKIKFHSTFPILNSLEEIPVFFKQERSTASQNSLTQKNNAIAQKLAHSDIFDKHQQIKQYAINHKMIYHNANEIYFYKKILDTYQDQK